MQRGARARRPGRGGGPRRAAERPRHPRQHRGHRLDHDGAGHAAGGVGGRVRGQRARHVPLQQARPRRSIDARGSGNIVNIASVAGSSACATAPPTAPPRARWIALTRALAVDHVGDGVRVNAVAPGPSVRHGCSGWLRTPGSRSTSCAPVSRWAASASRRRSRRPWATSSPTRRVRDRLGADDRRRADRSIDAGARHEPGEAGASGSRTSREAAARAARCLVRVLEVGVCGTDREISRRAVRRRPRTAALLVLGHEMLARVERDGHGFSPRRPGRRDGAPLVPALPRLRGGLPRIRA